MRYALCSAVVLAIIVGSTVAGARVATNLSDAQIREQIIHESVASYKGPSMRLPLRLGAQWVALRCPQRL